MNVQSLLHTIDGISTWVGKAAAWLMIVLMSVVCIEVFKRYIVNMPTAWIFDAENMLYGSLFMLCGAYTLAQNAHVRGDFLYSSMRPRTQAALDLILYIVFFLPGIAALIYAGYYYAADSWRINEHSNVTADGPPVYHFKTVIPIAGALIMLQGIAEIVRCIVCLKTGEWPSRLHDVAEIDVIEEQLAHSEYVDEESRKMAIEGAARIDEMARQRGMGGETKHMSDPALGLLMLALIVVVIMMGFATAFTLMGLGMFFGFIAFYDPSQHWTHNKVFDLMVQRTYGAMTNDVLISIPLFVLMGYVMERGALVDKMFYSIQLAFRRLPASLAVATLIVCTFWGIASGLVGAVVVLMGVIAFNPMLRAGYDIEARRRRHHRRRHARHPDPALGDDHRLCGGRRPIGRQAVRGGDAARLLPGVPLSRLCHRLGDDQSEDRPAAAGGADPRQGAGMDHEASGALLAQPVRRAAEGAGLARAGEASSRSTASR